VQPRGLRGPDPRANDPLASHAHPSLLPLDRSSDSLRKVGGKAVQLQALSRLGALLPETWVLDVAPFRELVESELPHGHDPHSLLKLSQSRARIERAGRARDRLLAARLPPELTAALGALVAELLAKAPWGLAVRSSPTCEDDSVAFMAGLSTAVLGVQGGEALCQAVLAIWSSAFLPRTLGYLNRRKVRDLGVAVVIQPVVRGEVVGVLSTRAPASAVSPTWRTGERLINATYGLGAIVKGGDAVVDVVRITKEGELVSAVIAEKRSELTLARGFLEEIPVAPSRATELSLSPGQLRQLAELASRLAQSTGAEAEPRQLEAPDGEAAGEGKHPGGDGARAEGAEGRAGDLADASPGKQNEGDDAGEREREEPEGDAYDVSFAFEGEQLYVLQGQRGPSLGFPEGGDAGTVWSRATVTEALAGVVSPLTWSMSEPFVEAGFRRAFQRLGCSVPRDERLVANIHGRAYLNLSALMRIAVQLPGVSPAAVGQLAGAEGLDFLEQQLEDVSRRSFYTRLPLTLARQLTDQGGLSSTAAEFETSAGEARKALLELDLAILPDDALVPTLRDVRTLLGRAIHTLTGATTAYVTSHLALRTALERSFPVEADRLSQIVAAGVPTLESTGVAVALGRVAEIARDEPGPRELLLSGSIERPDQLPPGPTRRALDRFLQEHGDHSQQAAELALPRWSERPEPLVAMLGAMVRGVRLDGARALSEVRARADRERASLERRMPLVERLLVRTLVERTRSLCEVRERVRGWLLRILAMTRSVALEIDRRILRVAPELGAGAAFYCTFDELLAGLSTGRPDVEHIVRLRRAEQARDRAQPDPPTTFVGAPPPMVLPPPGELVLRGVAASGGVATGKARVVRDVNGEAGLIQPGEILVVKTADIGLSPLFLVASGLVSQQGGRLTQGSVLARELGLPAVVHVPGATRVIRTGDLLRIDGDEGVVERVSPSAG
jgi:rifampicin phosphotransferase